MLIFHELYGHFSSNSLISYTPFFCFRFKIWFFRFTIFLVIIFSFKEFDIIRWPETLQTAFLNMDAVILPCLNLNHKELLLWLRVVISISWIGSYVIDIFSKNIFFKIWIEVCSNITNRYMLLSAVSSWESNSKSGWGCTLCCLIRRTSRQMPLVASTNVSSSVSVKMNGFLSFSARGSKVDRQMSFLSLKSFMGGWFFDNNII